MSKIFAITPYLLDPDNRRSWVFDDAAANLRREAFVCGADAAMDVLSAGKDRFLLRFSSAPFPGFAARFDLMGEPSPRGNWYRSDELNIEGWLCPALFCYFDSAPESLYLEAVV